MAWLVAGSRLAAVLLIFGSLTGCSAQSCTLIGAEPGVQVSIDASLTDRLSDGAMTIYVDGNCVDQVLPVKDTTPIQTCDGEGCDDPSVVAEPLTLVGRTAEVSPTGAIVKVVGRDRAGTIVASGAAQVHPSSFSPNGPDCGPHITTLAVILDASGLRPGS